ncbi:MAG: nucleoside phosphorylase [Bacilli bacterium]|nr:nucleoside phosphorylase [Bacilli bacterium]
MKVRGVDVKDIALLEFDSAKGLIEPMEQIKRIDMPKKVILTFFRDVILQLLEQKQIETIYTLKSESGESHLYKYIDNSACLFGLGVGAPLAGGHLEEIIALGGEEFVACGGAGVLIHKEVGSLILVESGVRDEGTSFHYMKPSREIEMDRDLLKNVCNTLDHIGISYMVGKTWTTDGFYRETKSKIAKRVEEGCVCVEMEFTALLAIAKFRQVKFSQILYSGDLLSGENWDGRKWHTRTELRSDVVQIAREIVLNY